MAVLPAALATSLLLFCTAAAPRDDTNQLGPTGSTPIRPGDWTMPELVPGGNQNTDPATLTTQTLADTATQHQPAASSTAITLTAAEKGIPTRVLAAYKEAADQLTHDQPGCHLPWELLAAIGKVESGHAAGRPITDDGTITRPILGPPLNGTGDVALIRDTDNGTLDGDTTYDRAVGPMQFIPTTWKTSGRDGSGDGHEDPHNIHDAALAAGHYLCAHDRDLTSPDQLRAAIYSYNPSDTYVRTVLTWMNGYRQGGATALSGASSPTPPPPAQSPPATLSPTTPPAPSTPAPAMPAPTRSLPDLTIIPLTPRAPSPTAAPPSPTPTPVPAPTKPQRTSPQPTPAPTPAPTLPPSPAPSSPPPAPSDSPTPTPPASTTPPMTETTSEPPDETLSTTATIPTVRLTEPSATSTPPSAQP